MSLFYFPSGIAFRLQLEMPRKRSEMLDRYNVLIGNYFSLTYGFKLYRLMSINYISRLAI